MKKKTVHMLLIVALVFSCWLQFPVGMHPKKMIPGIMATCVKTGLTEGEKCVLCGKFFIEQQVIPATGVHVYDDDFDNSCNICSALREVNCVFEFVNHRVVLYDENENHKNWRVDVYKLGDKTVKNPSNEVALQAIDATAKTYWNVKGINKIMLTEAGNYVLLLKYDDANRAGIKVPMEITITDDPILLVGDDNRLTVIDKNENNKNHTVTAFCLGSATVENPEDEDVVSNVAVSTETYTGLSLINETKIFKGGNYVFYLRYETADGNTHRVVVTETLASCPMLRVDENNKLIVTNYDETHKNIRAFVYYLGDEKATDIYDEAALEELAGGHKPYWDLERIGRAVLKEPGNYVIHLHYNEPGGPNKTVALRVTI